MRSYFHQDKQSRHSSLLETLQRISQRQKVSSFCVGYKQQPKHLTRELPPSVTLFTTKNSSERSRFCICYESGKEPKF